LRQELKKITDLTINDLLNKNIILPSTYFDKFNYHAKELEIDLDDEKFKHEINKIILEDYQAIENYMNLIASSATSLQESTKNATNAILNKDIDSLKTSFAHIFHANINSFISSAVGCFFVTTFKSFSCSSSITLTFILITKKSI
jgi:hypothetical protein